MNNAQHFKSGKRLLEAFRLLTETCNAEGIPAETTMPALADFAVCGRVSTALCRSIGEIVRYEDGDGIRYGTVRKYDRGCGCPSTARDCIGIGTDLSLVVKCGKLDLPHKMEAHNAVDRIEAAYKAETGENARPEAESADLAAEGGGK